MQTRLSGALGGTIAGAAYEVGTGIINVAALTIFLAIVYRKLPQCPVEWKAAYIGAAITAVILIIGEAALSLYFTKLHPAAPYGAAGGIVLLLIWIYYSAQLMLFGAEITRASQARIRPPAAAGARTGEVSEDLRRYGTAR
jgi:membrane protein